MITVLILDGLSEHAQSEEDEIQSDLSKIYIPLLTGILLFNGIICTTVKLKGLEYEYTIIGKNNDNLIYAPCFDRTDAKYDKLSFIYTESTAPSSVSFRIASHLRNLREEAYGSTVFINQLHEKDDLKRFSPIILDNIKVTNDSKFSNILYNFALITAQSIAQFYSIEFKDPATT